METVKVISGVERRRRFSPAGKQAIVEEGMLSGNSISSVARKYGIAPSQIFNWRRRMKD